MIRDTLRPSCSPLPTPSSPGAAPASGPVTAPARPDAAALSAQVRTYVAGLLGEDDPAFTADLVATFVETARAALAEAEAALVTKDAIGLGAAAHQLRGSASNVGLLDLTDRWAEIDEAVRTGGLSALLDTADGPVHCALTETAQTVELLAAPEGAR